MDTSQKTGKIFKIILFVTGLCLVCCFSCFGYLYYRTRPDLELLSRVSSPDGKLEARIVRIIGGPPMGGAVVWQEVQLAKCGSRTKFIKWDSNPGFVISILDEGEMPAAAVQWVGPRELLVVSDKIPGRIVGTKMIFDVTVKFSTK